MTTCESTGFRAFAATAATVLAFGTGCVLSGARAEVVERYQVNQWVIEANAAGGEFQNCSMSLANSRGAKVLVVLGRDGKWGIGVMNPAFNLRPGATDRIAYWVDDVVPRGGRATAADARTLVVSLENPTQLFEEFRLGSMMNVEFGNQTLQFSLNGTGAALSTLANCRRQHVQEAKSRD